MALFRVRTARELLRTAVANFRATAEVNDLRDGSDIKQILAAFARVAEMLSIDTARLLTLFSIDRAEGVDLDLRAREYMPDGFERVAAGRAVGTVRWTRQTTGGDITIPAGTLVRGSNGQAYVTTVAGRIPAGVAGTISQRTDGGVGDILARADAAGLAGNTDVGTVTQQVTSLPGAASLTNPTPFLGGRDAETDDAFRGRIRARTRALARAIPEALEQRALEATANGRSVTSARAVRSPWVPAHATVYIDDGTGTAAESANVAGEDLVTAATGGETRFFTSRRPWNGEGWTVTLHPAGGGAAVVLVKDTDYKVAAPLGLVELSPTVYPDGLTADDRLTIGAYTVYTGLIAAAQRLLTGDPLDRTVPAYHGEGVEIQVLAPTVQWQTVTVRIVTSDAVDHAATALTARAVVAAYVNGLTMGEDVIVAEIIERVMGVDGVIDCTVTAPAANVPIADAEIARVTTDALEVT